MFCVSRFSDSDTRLTVRSLFLSLHFVAAILFRSRLRRLLSSSSGVNWRTHLHTINIVLTCKIIQIDKNIFYSQKQVLWMHLKFKLPHLFGCPGWYCHTRHHWYMALLFLISLNIHLHCRHFLTSFFLIQWIVSILLLSTGNMSEKDTNNFFSLNAVIWGREKIKTSILIETKNKINASQ